MDAEVRRGMRVSMTTIRALKGPLFAAYMAGQHRVSVATEMHNAREFPKFRKFWVERARWSHRQMMRELREAQS